ncbi:hypothetical protein CC1G_15162 [Coprinopsis cinerea okayama7|uniref:Uncharacterized protein n=1 Tax=Coprinopsis cinerea (strain Okayama-7 / 130 / ATCC MYA-4618 / FGSC 9003) TaxID=240176 RepID=D6RPS9_COPC7|nr:hypothetical protein CC1G_15162 [Coprinopsis cinerea okayama7\|eukprot:XP_002910523.1 hypothetical protein CC1G_15162 [Coprinopsis cinerea okayama7\
MAQVVSPAVASGPGQNEGRCRSEMEMYLETGVGSSPEPSASSCNRTSGRWSQQPGSVCLPSDRRLTVTMRSSWIGET